MNELNEISRAPNAPIRPLGSTGRFAAPGVADLPPVRGLEDLQGTHSDGGFDFRGVDSLGAAVKGFVQTEDAIQAAHELERAGISVESISEHRGLQRKNRRPRGADFATLAEQFGDLMEVGESPTQVCRLLSYAQTNTMLADSLLNASDLIMNGRSLSEAFAAQRDHKGEPLFPVTFICA